MPLPLDAGFDDVARDMVRRARLRRALWRWWDAAAAARRAAATTCRAAAATARAAAPAFSQ